MTNFILRRLVLLVPLSLGVTLVAFIVTNAIPNDPVLALVGDATATQNPHSLEVYRHAWGFDQPLPIRFLTYLEHVLHGDFGTSILTLRPVSDDIRAFLPATVELSVAGLLIALLLGIPLGVLAALKHNTLADHAARLLALTGYSAPQFWLALVAIQVFYVDLRIAPSIGRLDISLDPPQHITGLYTVDSLLTGNWTDFSNALAHLALPAFVLGVTTMGLFARMVRESMLRTLNSDYVRTARSKGLPERRVIVSHALRNALIPTVTVIGLGFASLMEGAVLIETIFGWAGLGRYTASAAANLDLPAVMTVTMLSGFLFIVTNLAVDILYGVLDPRIRYS